MMKKILSVLISVLLLGTVFSAVGCNKEEKKVVSTKTQLYVGNCGGGFGEEWLSNLIARFEEKYKDYSFEPGKVGIQVWKDTDKTKYAGDQLETSITGSDRDVIFANYMSLYSFVNEDSSALLDITDIVTQPLDKMGDTGTIEDKIQSDEKDYFNVNGKYYAIPYFSGFTGIVYDVDLFDSKGLYLRNNGTAGAKLDDPDISAGPDGKEGTYDDGLPATYEEFFEMCNFMKNTKGITPFIWTGQYTQAYTSYLYEALFVDYEGKDRASLQYNAGEIAGKNTTGLVTGFENGQPLIQENVEISRQNYKELAKQPGRYYALKFWEQLIDGQYYDNLSFDDSESNLLAQADFLESTMDTDKIAMILEGTWWENEAEDVFNDMVSINEKYSKYNRRFGFMPMPKADESRLGKNVLRDGVANVVVIRGNIEERKIEAAKTFVQFACTEQSLKEITKTTGITCALDYELTEEELSKMTYFCRSVWNLQQNSDIVYARFETDDVETFVRGSGYNAFIERYSRVGEVEETNFANAMLYRDVTAEQYFNGLYDYMN